MVADWSATMDRDDVLARCSEGGGAQCGPVYAIDEIFEDPHYAHRGNILRVEDERVGELAIPNVVPMMMGTPGRVNWLGPKLGSHTDEVLRDLLGLPPDRIADLHARGRRVTAGREPWSRTGFAMREPSGRMAGSAAASAMPALGPR